MSAENFTATVSGVSPFDQSRVFHSPDGDIATTVVLAIAEVEGVEATDLEFVLNDYIDPDALNRLFDDDRTIPSTDAMVYLRIAGHDVYVSPNGEVVVD